MIHLMWRVAGVLVGLLVAFSLLWMAGEKHRENCMRDEKSGCSVLPWVAGRSYCDTHTCVKVNVPQIRVR
jgi:hypothetical protein